MLQAAKDKLAPRIPVLQSQADELRPLVEMAKEYASNLTLQAEILDEWVNVARMKWYNPYTLEIYQKISGEKKSLLLLSRNEPAKVRYQSLEVRREVLYYPFFSF